MSSLKSKVHLSGWIVKAYKDLSGNSKQTPDRGLHPAKLSASNSLLFCTANAHFENTALLCNFCHSISSSHTGLINVIQLETMAQSADTEGHWSRCYNCCCFSWEATWDPSMQTLARYTAFTPKQFGWCQGWGQKANLWWCKSIFHLS